MGFAVLLSVEGKASIVTTKSSATLLAIYGVPWRFLYPGPIKTSHLHLLNDLGPLVS